MAERPLDSEQRQPGQVNVGYASLQLAKALQTGVEHDDGETRRRALEKVAKWEQVIRGVLAGSISVGSRTPVADAPAWATLEVLTGGFATGALLAGGPLQPHELSLLEQFSHVPADQARLFLNSYFLSEEGLALLQSRLPSGSYEINLPEEGALLVVAWLLKQGRVEQARTLLDQLTPFFSQLRFYPILTDAPQLDGVRVHLQNVQSTIQDLAKIRPNRRVMAQREASEVWAPYYDQLIAQALDTVVDEQPGRQYPSGWRTRTTELLAAYGPLRQRHSLCGKPEKRRGHFYQLRQLLDQMARSPESLKRQQLGQLSRILQASIAKRGLPGSSKCASLRAQQQSYVAAPLHADVAKVVVGRMEGLRKNGGVDDVAPLQRSLDATEAERYQLPVNCTIPESIQRKVERCLNETAAELVARGLITSGETLARVLPQMTSGIRAAGISDPELQKLYAAIYRAFRRRRSLLLLNLEHQVRLEELPWIAQLDRCREDRLSTTRAAEQALKEVSRLAIWAFPQVILPNKLLQEMRALAKSAKVEIPLVDEIAADIFMGQFGNKFLSAANCAGRLLGDSLYQRYYAIDYAAVANLSAFTGRRTWGTVDEFAKYCADRAGVSLGTWRPATNGMIIEQQQILTTQNLAICFAELGLAEPLGDQLFEMSQRCFRWICRRQQNKIDDWHTRLVMIKNTAYAWRQMVFYLSQRPSEIDAFLAWADEHLAAQSKGFQQRFQPAMSGLRLAAQGQVLEGRALCSPGVKQFLGWSDGRHWLSPPKE